MEKKEIPTLSEDDEERLCVLQNNNFEDFANPQIKSLEK